MPLVVRRNPDETWRECVARYGKKYGLQREALKEYDDNVAYGESPGQAALEALMEWDMLDYEEDK